MKNKYNIKWTHDDILHYDNSIFLPADTEVYEVIDEHGGNRELLGTLEELINASKVISVDPSHDFRKEIILDFLLKEKVRLEESFSEDKITYDFDKFGRSINYINKLIKSVTGVNTK